MKPIKLILFLMIFLMVITGSLAGASDSEQPEPGSFIHLQYATFDPLVAEPAIPQRLTLQQESLDEPAPFIVQFDGPIQPEWKASLEALRVPIDNYLPNNAYLVRLDGASDKTTIEGLAHVRWAGVYQPAYKLAPSLADYQLDIYNVQIASWADATAVQQDLEALGGAVSGNGRFLTLNIATQDLALVSHHPDIIWIEPFTFFETFNDTGGGILNAPTAWGNGYTGNGQIITVADSGLDTGVDSASIGDIHADFDNRVTQIASKPVVSAPGCITNTGADDGPSDTQSGHGTHVAGSTYGNGAASSGQYRGTAYEATATFQAIEQFTTWTGICTGGPTYALTGIPNDLNDLFQESYNWGARVHTNSWGSNAAGQYTSSSSQADEFIWNNKDFTILFAAGNSGTDGDSNGYVDEDSMGSPATAKNVITIGASDNLRATGGYNPGGACSLWGNCWPSDFPANPTSSDSLSDNAGEMAAFSSRGPTDDGRIKPDLVAPGTNILSTRSSLISGNGWGAFNADYMYNGGTSMATPLAAGGAAVVREYLAEAESMSNPSAALIKAILINSAVDIGGYGNSAQEAGQPIPNNHEGWGRIDLAAATTGTNRTLIDDQSTTTTVTKVFSHTVSSSAEPLKISLVWSDYPSSAGASINLVNNLNLSVTAPDGSTTYLGNHFSGGWSATGGAADSVNNVENVYIQTPTTGDWVIRVIGSNIPQGPQPFALVISGIGTTTQLPDESNASNFYVYLPVILKPLDNRPEAGFWETATTAVEFYVTPDRASVDDFAIYINVSGCGGYKITRTVTTPIVDNNFSFTGAYQASGSFSSTTAASGTTQLTSYNIGGCGLVSGGPFAWSATWQNSSQPRIFQAERVGPELVDPSHEEGFTVTRIR